MPDPVSRLRESGALYDEYIYDWVAALQAYWLKQPEFGDKLLAAVDGTDPDVLRHAPRENVLNIMYPPMNLLTQVARGDQDRFNAELAKTLDWHKDYWTRDEERALDAEGLVALGPLASPALRSGPGSRSLSSPSISPKYLLDGGWVNEFPT